MMKKIFTAAILFAAFFSAASYAASPEKDLEKLLPPRTIVCFFDGDRMDELVLNARGKLTFIYADSKLSDALKRLKKEEYGRGGISEAPPQIFTYAAKTRKGHALFIARIQALKGWTFDPSLISIGGYHVSKEDIITGVSDNRHLELTWGERELSKGYDGFIGFFVPGELIKPGETTYAGYSADRTDWKIPGKNQ